MIVLSVEVRVTMKRKTAQDVNLKKFFYLNWHRFANKLTRKNVLFIIVVLALIVFLVLSPRTVASGNGYKHQILKSEFHKCKDGMSDDCTGKAQHKIKHFFGSEYYCNVCWEDYGEYWFSQLSNYDEGDAKDVCAWCNGTGYDGNGAEDTVEYVLKKTPCTHCNGSGEK